MRLVTVIFSSALLMRAQSTDPVQLLQPAKQLLRQPNKANEALPLLKSANDQWQATSSNDPSYTEAFDLYVQLAKPSQPIADLEPLVKGDPLLVPAATERFSNGLTNRHCGTEIR